MLPVKSSFSKILKGSEGLALITVIFVAAFFLIFVTGGLYFAQLNLKITSNFKLATQAVEVADAGLQHGLAVIPWVWDFNGQLNCGTPPCPVVSQTSFPSVSGFTYTVTAKNDPADASATIDSNSRILVTAQADGPSNTKKIVEAYVRRSVASFKPPAALYINAASATPAIGSDYFDDDDSVKIIGNDTNANNISNEGDDTAGPQAPLLAVATTNSSVTSALINEYTTKYNGISLHNVIGVGSEPSIGTTDAILDIDTIASKFYNQPGAVIFLNGYNSNNCSSLTPCKLGTSSNPQITYIKDDSTSNTQLKSNVSGYGVLILEGRTTISGNFNFYGMVVHKRSHSSHYISVEDNAIIYGATLFGSFDEGDGKGKKVRFRVEDFSHLYYSSAALTMVESNWGSLLPKPPRVLAWLDK
jgi:hypothetical protein